MVGPHSFVASSATTVAAPVCLQVNILKIRPPVVAFIGPEDRGKEAASRVNVHEHAGVPACTQRAGGEHE